MLLGATVAIQTPSHGVTLSVIDFLHLVHISVATHTGNPPIQVSRVVKVNIIRGLVNSDPLNGRPFSKVSVGIRQRTVELIDSHCSTKTSKFRRTLFNMLVTIPTRVGAWNVRMTRVLYKTMAVTTVHAQLTHVQVVVVVNGLSGLVANSLRLGCCVIRKTSNNAGTKCSKTNRNFQRQ